MTNLCPGNRSRYSCLLTIAGIIIILLYFLYALLPRLPHVVFWNDEAISACLADNIIDAGLPYVTYGENELINGQYDANFMKVEAIHGWLSYYIVAAVGSILGSNELVYRLPSLAFGVLTLIFLAILGRALWGTHAGLIAAFLLAVQPAFQQYTRQCRYYTAAMFFIVLLIFACHYIRRKRHLWPVVPLLFLLLFHSFQLFFYAFFLSYLVIVGIARLRVTQSNTDRCAYPYVFRTIILTIILILPWLIFFSIGRDTSAINLEFGPASILRHLRIIVTEVVRFFPFFFFIGIAQILHSPYNRCTKDVIYYIGISCLFVAAVPAGVYEETGGYLFYRYFLFLMPLGALVSAHGILFLFKRKKVYAWGSILLIVIMESVLASDAPYERLLTTVSEIVKTNRRTFIWNATEKEPNPELKALEVIRRESVGQDVIYSDFMTRFTILEKLGRTTRVRSIGETKNVLTKKYLVVHDSAMEFREELAVHYSDLVAGCEKIACDGCRLDGSNHAESFPVPSRYEGDNGYLEIYRCDRITVTGRNY